MGESKNKKALFNDFFDSLDENEKTIFTLSNNVYQNIIRAHSWVSGCYQITFFLKAALEKEYGIKSNAVIGYVNDGTDDVFISHAWLEYNNKKTDLTLTNVTSGLSRGALLILDKKFQDHRMTDYTYHLQMTDEAKAEIQNIIENGGQAIVFRKEKEHNFMLDICESTDKIIEFLNTEPRGINYEKLLSIASTP